MSNFMCSHVNIGVFLRGFSAIAAFVTSETLYLMRTAERVIRQRR